MVLQHKGTRGLHHKWEWAEDVEQVTLYMLLINLHNICIAAY